MRLKERLQNNNIPKRLIGKKNEEVLSDSLFVNLKEINQHITDLVQNGKNIIFVTNKSFDRIIIANYFKFLLKKLNAKILDDFNYQFNDFDNQVNILPNTDINTLVKVSQQIIYGCRSFILGFNFGSFDNIVNKLKLLVALNNKNLSSADIVTLIGSMNAVIVYVEKNAEGLFYISQIDEIKYKENIEDLEIKTILSGAAEEAIEVAEPIEEPVGNTEPAVEVSDEQVIETQVEAETEMATADKKEQEEEQEPEPVQEKKLNKYQLLREKIRKNRENLKNQDTVNQKEH